MAIPTNVEQMDRGSPHLSNNTNQNNYSSNIL